MSVPDRWANRAAEHPPPGPFRAGFWRSPLRGPWFTGLSAQPFLARWLVVTAVLFAISAVTLVVHAMQRVEP